MQFLSSGNVVQMQYAVLGNSFGQSFWFYVVYFNAKLILILISYCLLWYFSVHGVTVLSAVQLALNIGMITKTLTGDVIFNRFDFDLFVSWFNPPIVKFPSCVHCSPGVVMRRDGRGWITNPNWAYLGWREVRWDPFQMPVDPVNIGSSKQIRLNVFWFLYCSSAPGGTVSSNGQTF